MRPVIRSDGKRYISATAAAKCEGVSVPYLTKLISIGRSWNGHRFRYADDASAERAESEPLVRKPPRKSRSTSTNAQYATCCPVCGRWTYRVSGFCKAHEMQVQSQDSKLAAYRLAHV